LGGAFDGEFGFWLPVTQRRWAAAGELFPPKKMAPSRFDFFHFEFKDYIRAVK
jgi:hypothetical protein